MNPICPYCGKESEQVMGDVMYDAERPDLANKVFYRCLPCGASVGCHPGTDKPLGSLANRETRNARMQAHNTFDDLWKNGSFGHMGTQSRRAAYEWLAGKLGIKVEDCHMGLFDLGQCRKVVAVCLERSMSDGIP